MIVGCNTEGCSIMFLKAPGSNLSLTSHLQIDLVL
jgi:hypothetical protein